MPTHIPRMPRMSQGATTKARKTNLRRSISIFLIAAVLLFVCGVDIALAADTLVNGWIPLGVSVIIAFYLGLILHSKWRWLTQTSNRWGNALCSMVIATPLLLLAFYGTNWLGAAPEAGHTEEVTVESRYYKKRHHTRRVGRRYLANGEEYKVCYATVVFPDGFRKEMSLPHSRYRKLRAGQQLTVEVTTGLWGVRVLKSHI